MESWSIRDWTGTSSRQQYTMFTAQSLSRAEAKKNENDKEIWQKVTWCDAPFQYDSYPQVARDIWHWRSREDSSGIVHWLVSKMRMYHLLSNSRSHSDCRRDEKQCRGSGKLYTSFLTFSARTRLRDSTKARGLAWSGVCSGSIPRRQSQGYTCTSTEILSTVKKPTNIRSSFAQIWLILGVIAAARWVNVGVIHNYDARFKPSKKTPPPYATMLLT